MAKHADQSLVLLAILAGCFETLRQTNSFSRIDMRQAVTNGYDATCSAIINFPGFSNREWVKARRERFTKFVMDHPDSGYSATAILCMCETIIIDLIELHGHNKDKYEMLWPIFEAVKCIRKFCDRDGNNFEAFEKGKELIDELYRIIELKEFA
jgi:hypothetical protein